MAIAFDAKSDGTSTVASSISWSHTCAGDMLLVDVRQDNGDIYSISSVTFNGSALTLIDQVIMPTRNHERYSMYYLLSPSFGTSNVVVTQSGSGGLYGTSASYSDVSALDNFTKKTQDAGSGTTITTSLTTVANNCWTFLTGFSMASPGSARLVASTNTTDRNAGSGIPGCFDNNASITPAGSYSMSCTFSSDAPACTIMASFASGGAFIPRFIDII